MQNQGQRLLFYIDVKKKKKSLLGIPYMWLEEINVIFQYRLADCTSKTSQRGWNVDATCVMCYSKQGVNMC